MEADRGVCECLRSDGVDDIARSRDADQISSTDAQRMVVQADPDLLEEEDGAAVEPAPKRRRRTRRWPRTNGPESARAGPA